ncbi:hypothetical protein [Actinotalea sp.]|uniref:hypothetical protein n=1 Tax=Actinotalea sp. TaxID=1872145 RepID=UPI00356551B0
MGPTQVFVSGYSRVLAVATIVIAVVVVLGTVGAGDLRLTLLALSGGALAGLAGWALFWRPLVEVSDGGVRVVNVLRTIEIPWPVLDRAEVRWSLVVHTLDARWTAWGAPRSSAAASAVRRSEQTRVDHGRPSAGLGRAVGRLPSAASAERVADAIAMRQASLLAAGHLDGAQARARESGLKETITWHRGTIAAALTLAALTGVLAVA